MKKLFILASVAMVIGSIPFACSDDSPEHIETLTEAYVIGYEPCAGYEYDIEKSTLIANSYFLVTANSKDTLFAVDIPDCELAFPISCLNGDARAFSAEYEKAFKISIRYTEIPEADEKIFICDAMHNNYSRFTGKYKQVRIDSLIEQFENDLIVPDNGNWTFKFPDLYAYNRTKVSIENGIYGTLIQAEGNCMPIIDENSSCMHFPVKRKIRIYECTQLEQVEWESRFCSEVKTRLIATVESDDEGFFETTLPPGKYSVFIEEKGLLYANGFDSEGHINPVLIEASGLSEKNLKLDYASY